MSGSGSRVNYPPTLESLSVAKDAASHGSNVGFRMKFWTKSEITEATLTLNSIASMASLEPGLKIYKKDSQAHQEGLSHSFQLEGPQESVINFYGTLRKKFSAKEFQQETLGDDEHPSILKLYKLGSENQDRSSMMPVVYMSLGAPGAIRRRTSIEQIQEFSKGQSQTFNKITDGPQENYGAGLEQHKVRSLNFFSKPLLPGFRREIMSKELNHTTNNIRFNCLRAIANRNINDRHSRNFPIVAMQVEDRSHASFSSLQLPVSDKLNISNIGGSAQHLTNPKTHQSQNLHVSKFDFREYNIVNLCNLFGNYGNIDAAWYNEDLGECLLMFSSAQGARYAKDNLDRVLIQGRNIKVNYSASSNEVLAGTDRLPLKYTPLKRFSTKGSGLPNQANPVSRTLHLTYTSESDTVLLDDSTLLVLLSQSGEVTRLKRELFKKKKNMWFAEFKSETEAVRVLMREHGKLFHGGVLRVSFTKTI